MARISSRYTKTYATEKRLLTALHELGLLNEDDGGDGVAYVICRTAEGRWTAVFSAQTFSARPAHLGFMVI